MMWAHPCSAGCAETLQALKSLQEWVESRNYAGYDPYDWLNSPAISRLWNYSRGASSIAIQVGRRFGGATLRRILNVPPSVNPKALGLFMSGYCDLMRRGNNCSDALQSLKRRLKELRAPAESEYAWGYDWNYCSMRGGVLPAFAANSIATVFCAEALLDLHDVAGDNEALAMAHSAGRFCLTRLNRSFENSRELCFSYTPDNRTLIFNSSVLVGALLARLGARDPELLHVAKQTMAFLAARQRADGSWPYGCSSTHQWIDGFHTGYNLSGMAAYRRRTGDTSFDSAMLRGYTFYKDHCFSSNGTPKYFHDRVHPIDIHACSQAVLTFCDFAGHDPGALARAAQVAIWTVTNMRSPDGYFFYQRHRFWTNRTPYMRWSQAWMFRALARLHSVLSNA